VTQQRPEHPDFEKLRKVVVYQDQQADSGIGIPEIVDGAIDVDALGYMARQRAIRAVRLVGPTSDAITLLATIWIDAFVSGVHFQQEGGHVDPDS